MYAEISEKVSYLTLNVCVGLEKTILGMFFHLWSYFGTLCSRFHCCRDFLCNLKL